MEKKTHGKRKKLLLVIILVCLLLVAAGLGFLKWLLANRMSDGPDMADAARMTALSYDVGPDEYGRSESIWLRDGQIGYSGYYNTNGLGDTSKGSCPADNALYDDLEQIITENDMRSWTGLPENDIVVDDGQTTTLCITFADGTELLLGDAYEMPENGWKAVREIVDLLQDRIDAHAAVVGAVQELLPADDSGLTLLVDYCEKTTAAESGGGYSEIVLYRDDTDGSYQLHTYSQYGEEPEMHRAYTAPESVETAALDLISSLKLSEDGAQAGTGPDGSGYVLKYRQDGELLRLSSDELGEDGAKKLTSVGELLYSFLPADSGG